MKINKIVGIMFFLVGLLFLYFDYNRGWYSTNLYLFMLCTIVAVILFMRKK